MDRRIFGIENEYGVTCTFKGQRRLSPDEVARYLFRKVVSWGRSSNVFLRNGARLYLDVGSHPEYATPECDDIVDLVAHDKAGERVLEGLLVDAERRLRDEGIDGDVYLFKNNTDSAGNSYGCHENYLVSRHGEFAKLADVLIPFLVTRQIIVGAGKVIQTPRGAMYSVSQRAEHIWEGVSSATTRSRPIINTRDEPHADAERYRRLHVIVGDSNMSETTTMLKVATCDLVLRMIEEGVVMRDLTMENPIRAIREISHDMTGRRKVRLANGREASALEIQGDYLARARDFVDRRELHTPVIDRALDLWERGLKAVESDDLGLVEREIDWVIKWKLIDRYRSQHGLPLSHARVAQLDLAYHDIHRGRGLYYLLRAAGRGGAGHRRPADLRGQVAPAADHPGAAARRVHRQGPGTPPRLHRGLGPPEAQRPGAAHRAVQGPVPRPRRARAEADRRHVAVAAGPLACSVRVAATPPPIPRGMSMRRRLAAAAVLLLTLSGTAACGSDSGSDAGSGSGSGDAIDGLTVSGDFGEEPTIKVDGLNVDDVEETVPIEGDGTEVQKDGAALYRFVIAKGADGETVASNYQDNAPQQLLMSQENEVITDAVLGKTIGSRVVLAMPVKKLLGDQGAPQVGLEPDDDLVMVIDLIEEAEAPLTGPEGKTVEPPADAPKVVEKDGDVTALDFSDAPKEAPEKLQVIPLIEGEGEPVKEDDPVTVDYFGAVWGNGDKPFDESYSRDPASFTLSQGQPHRRLGEGPPGREGRQPGDAGDPGRPRVRRPGLPAGHPGRRDLGLRHRCAWGRRLTRAGC